jgi:hypothetical protein
VEATPLSFIFIQLELHIQGYQMPNMITDSKEDEKTIRVLTFNVDPGMMFGWLAIWTSHWKSLWASKRIGLQINAIATHAPDIICLQDVFCKASRLAFTSAFQQTYHVSESIGGRGSCSMCGLGTCLVYFLWMGTALMMLLVINFIGSVMASDWRDPDAQVEYWTLMLMLVPICCIISKARWRHTALEQWLSGDASGLMIMVKKTTFKSLETSTVKIPHQKGDWRNAVVPRCVVMGEATLIDGRTICVTNVNINAHGAMTHQEEQAEDVCELIKGSGAQTTILCGGFNVDPESLAMDHFSSVGFVMCGPPSRTHPTLTSTNSLVMKKFWRKNSTTPTRPDYIQFHSTPQGCELEEIRSDITMDTIPPPSSHFGVMSTLLIKN